MNYVICTLAMLCTFAIGQIYFQLGHAGGMSLLIVWSLAMAALSYINDRAPERSSQQTIDEDRSRSEARRKS